MELANKRAQTEFRKSAECTTTLACTTLCSSSAIFTIVMDVKTMTQSVPISNLNIVNGASAGQGKWWCGLPAKIIDREQVAVQELMVFKRVPHTKLDGHHHNQQKFVSDCRSQ